MIRPIPFWPSLEPCAKLTPVQVKIRIARMIAGGGLFPSGGWNNSNWRLKIVLTNKNKIAAKAKPIKGENNNALPTLIT